MPIDTPPALPPVLTTDDVPPANEPGPAVATTIAPSPMATVESALASASAPSATALTPCANAPMPLMSESEPMAIAPGASASDLLPKAVELIPVA